MNSRWNIALRNRALTLVCWALPVTVALGQPPGSIGREVSVMMHLRDGEEFQMTIPELVAFGSQLFRAKWTSQEGQGRPRSKGTGVPLSDQAAPLVFPRNFNRLSGPDANSCFGCHNSPFAGGGGDRSAEVFVLAQRFDFLDFDRSSTLPTKGAIDEAGNFLSLGTATNDRKSIGMNGSGFIEMLARQMSAELQAERDTAIPGKSVTLTAKGISFGSLTRWPDGSWDVSQVAGIPAPSLISAGTAPPSLLIRPFHQVGNVVSVRQFTNNAYNHHHGIQAEERFGLGVDADGDGFVNELTTADVTAATLFQITLNVPGQVLPHDAVTRAAITVGEQLFIKVGCASCHIPALPLTSNSNPGVPGQPGWIYSEPSPYNPTTGPNSPNLIPGVTKYPISAPPLLVDLTSDRLPLPRLTPVRGVIMVPAYTDLKLHTMADGPNDPNAEPIDQNEPVGSPGFFAGNQKFLTRRLWGLADSGPYGHAGKFTTIREAINLGHNGEATTSRIAFQALFPFQQDEVIEFLKSLRVLPPGTPCTVVDEDLRCPKKGDDREDR